MKGFALLAALLALLAALIALLALAPKEIAAQQTPSAQLVTIPVSGMTWPGWEAPVELAVRRLPGVFEAKASYREGKVVVRYDPALVSPDNMANAITSATYYTVGKPVVGGELPGAKETAKGATAVIRVEGMSDERSGSRVTQAMGAVGPAVLAVSLDTAQSTLTATYDDKQVSAQALLDAIKRGTGLEAALVSSTFAQAEPGGGTDYTPSVLIGIAAVFAVLLSWYGFSWGRRRLARAGSTLSRPARWRQRRR